MNLQPVKGTKDILPEDYKLFLHVIDTARKVALNYGYLECAVPIFEYTELFERSLGDASDIVNKEMYTFNDRKGRSLTLRPEFTASVARSIISNGLQQNLPLKLFLNGPLFRYERPQKGRYRQLHQINFENVGGSDPSIDAEMIAMAYSILDKLALSESVTLELNTLGDEQTRQSYTKELVSYLEKYQSDLSEDSKIRLSKNPLRILDSKDESDKKILSDAPSIQEFLTVGAGNFFNGLLRYLDDLGVKYSINPKLVRGLDYYTHTVFEFTTDYLGAQGTVLAGGRYDNLIKQLSGNLDIPAIGFAAGIERLMLLFSGKIEAVRTVTLAVLDDALKGLSLKVAKTLRDIDIPVAVEHIQNPSKAMKKALESNAKFVIFIGSEEAKQNKFKLKDLDSREEFLLDLSQLINKVSLYEF